MKARIRYQVMFGSERRVIWKTCHICLMRPGSFSDVLRAMASSLGSSRTPPFDTRRIFAATQDTALRYAANPLLRTPPFDTRRNSPLLRTPPARSRVRCRRDEPGEIGRASCRERVEVVVRQ